MIAYHNASGLKATVPLMESDCYKDRLRAEYAQVSIRFVSLVNMIVKYEAGELDFIPNSPLELLKKQAQAMRAYAEVLEERAKLDGACLDYPLSYLYSTEEDTE